MNKLLFSTHILEGRKFNIEKGHWQVHSCTVDTVATVTASIPSWMWNLYIWTYNLILFGVREIAQWSRGPVFDFQNLYGDSQPSLIPVS